MGCIIYDSKIKRYRVNIFFIYKKELTGCKTLSHAFNFVCGINIVPFTWGHLFCIKKGERKWNFFKNICYCITATWKAGNIVPIRSGWISNIRLNRVPVSVFWYRYAVRQPITGRTEYPVSVFWYAVRYPQYPAGLPGALAMSGRHPGLHSPRGTSNNTRTISYLMKHRRYFTTSAKITQPKLFISFYVTVLIWTH